jgi:hypothetical protein
VATFILKNSSSKIVVACLSLIKFSIHYLNSFSLNHFSLGSAMKNRHYQGFPICKFRLRSIAIVNAPGQWAYYLGLHKLLLNVINMREKTALED